MWVSRNVYSWWRHVSVLSCNRNKEISLPWLPISKLFLWNTSRISAIFIIIGFMSKVQGVWSSKPSVLIRKSKQREHKKLLITSNVAMNFGIPEIRLMASWIFFHEWNFFIIETMFISEVRSKHFFRKQIFQINFEDLFEKIGTLILWFYVV